jgi:hypothetical protein
MRFRLFVLLARNKFTAESPQSEADGGDERPNGRLQL